MIDSPLSFASGAAWLLGASVLLSARHLATAAACRMFAGDRGCPKLGSGFRPIGKGSTAPQSNADAALLARGVRPASRVRGSVDSKPALTNSTGAVRLASELRGESP